MHTSALISVVRRQEMDNQKKIMMENVGPHYPLSLKKRAIRILLCRIKRMDTSSHKNIHSILI